MTKAEEFQVVLRKAKEKLKKEIWKMRLGRQEFFYNHVKNGIRLYESYFTLGEDIGNYLEGSRVMLMLVWETLYLEASCDINGAEMIDDLFRKLYADHAQWKHELHNIKTSLLTGEFTPDKAIEHLKKMNLEVTGI